MDYMEMVQNLGFPITIVAVCLVFIYKMYLHQTQDSKADKEKLYNVLEEANETNRSILESNREIVNDNRVLMMDLKNDICDIKKAVVK